jgi:hypothetical protein
MELVALTARFSALQAVLSPSVRPCTLFPLSPHLLTIHLSHLGHPLGASGARIIANLTHSLHRLDKKWAIGSACIGEYGILRGHTVMPLILVDLARQAVVRGLRSCWSASKSCCLGVGLYVWVVMRGYQTHRCDRESRSMST